MLKYEGLKLSRRFEIQCSWKKDFDIKRSFYSDDKSFSTIREVFLIERSHTMMSCVCRIVSRHKRVSCISIESFRLVSQMEIYLKMGFNKSNALKIVLSL